MKAQDFLSYLESQNLIPGQLLKKLHKKIEDAGREVSASSIASYLVKKDIVSKQEALGWMSGAENSLAKVEEELVVNVGAERDSQDTNDLINLAGPPSPGVTQPEMLGDEDMLVDADDIDIEIVDDIPPEAIIEEKPKTVSKRKAKSVEVEQVEEIEEVVELGAEQIVQPNADPLFDPAVGAVDPFSSPEQEQTVEQETAVAKDYSFGRKKRGNQWLSKWPLIGSGVALTLLILLGVIVFALSRVSPERLWDEANEKLVSGNYSGAREQFIQFYTKYPGEDDAGLAEVLAANCELRIPFDGGQWDIVYQRAAESLPRLEEENERFSDIHDDLAVILPRTAIGFSELALKESTISGKQSKLDDTLKMMELVAAPEFVPGSQRRRDTVERDIETAQNNIKVIQYQIRMEQDYEAALEEIDSRVEAGETDNAFGIFSNLSRQYPELESRQPLRDSLRKISKRESDLVNTIDVNYSGEDAKPESPVLNTVLLATRSGKPASVDQGAVSFLIDGSVYGFSTVDGKVLWRHFVGQQTLLHPLWVSDTYEEVLVIDQRDHSLMKVNAITGEPVWRTIIGSEFNSPVVIDERAVVSKVSGEIVSLDLSNGSASRATQLPQELENSPTVADRDPYIYQAGSYSNLYVISRTDLTCQEVYFLGHKPGMIVVPPFYTSGHLLVAVNGTDYCNLHVLRTTDRGLRLERAQSTFRLDGKVTTPIFKYGRWAIVVTNTGDVRMLEVNLGDEEQPVTVVASGTSKFKKDIINYLMSVDGNAYLAGAGLARLKIKKTQSKFEAEKFANNLDTFVGPTHKRGDVLYHVRRRNASALMSVSAVDAVTLSEIWRNDLSAPNAGGLFSFNDSLHAVSSQGDLFAMGEPSSAFEVIDQPIRASNVMQSLLFTQLIQLSDSQFVAMGPDDRRAILKLDLNRSPPSSLTTLGDSITNPTCESIGFANSLVVATGRGQIYRVNPNNGESIGAPFQPLLEPQVTINWNKPVVTKPDQEFVISDTKGRMFLVQADGSDALRKVAEFTNEFPFISQMAKVGERVYCVAQNDLNDSLVRYSYDGEFLEAGQVAIPTGYVAGPFVVGDKLLVINNEGKLLCFDEELNSQWSMDIPRDRFSGTPLLVDGSMLISMESGLVLMVNMESGETIRQFNVGQPLSGNPVFFDGKTIVTGLDGTVHLLDLEAGQ